MILLFREKTKKACIGKPIATQREKKRERAREREKKEGERGEKRFCDQCCRVDVKETSTEQQ